MREIPVQTDQRMQWVDVTRLVAAELPADAKAVLVYSPHTTAGVTINENADPDVQRDFFEKLRRSFPKDESFYRHDEGNSDAHILTSLVGPSVTVPVVNGKLQLGTWQGIYFCEFDGPRRRKLLVQYL
jgi:secondary thiamine-phosphate synthase enzyme